MSEIRKSTAFGSAFFHTPRSLLVALTAWLFALSASAQAQQPAKIRRIGFLTGASYSSQFARNEAFRQGLRDLGYVEGKDIIIEWRSYEGKEDLRPPFAAELVRLNVEVIVAGGAGDVKAAKEASATIPIVVLQGGDAIASGFAASLARPGGNITGLSTLRPELSGKRLELLKEIVPKLSQVAFIVSPRTPDYSQELKQTELAADVLGLKLQRLDIVDRRDIETAFEAAVKRRAGAVLFRVAGPYAASQRPQIAQLAVKSRLPAIYEATSYAEAGGLMSYGLSITDIARRAATYVDKILKGAKPADLPMEQPTKFEFVINLKVARQIGLTIPPNVLARADRVIR
jgi:putative ABC transport system substrate-binding protein